MTGEHEGPTEIQSSKPVEGSEIREVDPELVTELEQLPVEAHQKVYLLEMQLGLKPATVFKFFSEAWLKDETELPLDSEHYEELSSYVDRAGLASKTEDMIVNPDEYALRGTEGASLRASRPEGFEADIAKGRRQQIRNLFVGREIDDLQRMIEADHTNDSDAYGEAVGFPQTAIEGYVSRNRLTHEEFEELVPDEELQAYMMMVPSRDHWQEEVAIIKNRMEAVRAVSPTILQELVEENKA